ncbi:MAG: hypothetical protein WCT47_18645 [Betaproteobacteria bacterium]|jgi:hypothetical protein
MTDSLTEEIAAAAARLVVESGLEYGAAKHKAARALGRRGGNARVDMPSNEQVEDEVRAYIELFLGDSQPAEVAALREVALDWMQRLAEFRPHLAGAVWRGTATRESAVHVDLYCDDSKAAEIALLNMGVDHDVHVLDAGRTTARDVLSVSSPSRVLGHPVTVHLIVNDHDDLRGALRPDAKGRTWRGDLAALKRLMSSEGEGHGTAKE